MYGLADGMRRFNCVPGGREKLRRVGSSWVDIGALMRWVAGKDGRRDVDSTSIGRHVCETYNDRRKGSV